MITREDVAKRAGVSTAVVSYVINNGPRPVSKETKEKVLQAIEELGYRSNFQARSLSLKSTNIIGLIIPDSSNAFFSEVAKGIEEKSFGLGHHVIYCNTGGDIKLVENYIDALVSQRVRGLIFVTTSVPEKSGRLMERYGIPSILIDPETEIDLEQWKNTAVISANNYQGGYLAGQYLLNRGHQSFFVIAGKDRISPGKERLDGFMAALAERGASSGVAWAGDHMSDGYRVAHDLFSGPNHPSCIFACNDLLALGVLRAAGDQNISVPRDVAVIGFDDIEIANYFVPRLTTIWQPKYKMGELAAQLLLEHEDNFEKKQVTERKFLLDTELVIRESG